MAENQEGANERPEGWEYQPVGLPYKPYKDYRETWEKQAQFLNNLRMHISITAAAKETNIPTSQVYYWRKNDAIFREKFEEVYEECNGALEDEAVRRAYHGIDKPIYYEGQQIDTITEYSDTLLMFLLKGRSPDKFRERDRALAGAQSSVLIIPSNGRDVIQEAEIVDTTTEEKETDILNSRLPEEDNSSLKSNDSDQTGAD